MATPLLTNDALKFIKGMQGKHARQVLLKIIELAADPHPHDCKKLHGHPDLLRADAGEYRIIYRITGDTLAVVLIGKRNDDEVYDRLNRK